MLVWKPINTTAEFIKEAFKYKLYGMCYRVCLYTCLVSFYNKN